MKVLEKLGKRFPTSKSKRKYEYWNVECPDCLRPYKVMARNITNGTSVRCKSCGATASKSHSTKVLANAAVFPIKGSTIHGNKYDYTKVVYINCMEHVIISCPIHGDFLQTPNNHLVGKGCAKCGSITGGLNGRLTTSQFITNSIAIHGSIYDYSNTIYLTNDELVEVECPRHGTFLQTPHNHISGRGCQSCGDIRRNSLFINEPTILYYIKFIKSGVYKIGITLESRGVKTRFSNESIAYTVLSETLYNDGGDAYIEEQRILKTYYTYRHKGPPILKYGGNTELFSSDVLNLDLGEDI